jgi:hypothetical protein
MEVFGQVVASGEAAAAKEILFATARKSKDSSAASPARSPES